MHDKEDITGLRYIATKYISLSTHWDSNMGVGAGFYVYLLMLYNNKILLIIKGFTIIAKPRCTIRHFILSLSR